MFNETSTQKRPRWLWMVDVAVILSILIAVAMLLVTMERSAKASVTAAKAEAKRGADLSPKEYQSLMTHPVGGCEQFIQKCGDGRCRVYPVCADSTKRASK